MRTLVVAAAAIALALIAAAASAEGAKPDDPNGFGEHTAGVAQNVGGLGPEVSAVATTSDRGATPLILDTRENLGSTPNPPGKP
jgi:hypothetical protein